MKIATIEDHIINTLKHQLYVIYKTRNHSLGLSDNDDEVLRFTTKIDNRLFDTYKFGEPLAVIYKNNNCKEDKYYRLVADFSNYKEYDIEHIIKSEEFSLKDLMMWEEKYKKSICDINSIESFVTNQIYCNPKMYEEYFHSGITMIRHSNEEICLHEYENVFAKLTFKFIEVSNKMEVKMLFSTDLIKCIRTLTVNLLDTAEED